ncbi:MAG: hypothetical protein OXF02_07410 [Simkaniaceae bacterium]|nr:hypothetical protein [Simkaniaceae bacterium]
MSVAGAWVVVDPQGSVGDLSVTGGGARDLEQTHSEDSPLRSLSVKCFERISSRPSATNTCDFSDGGTLSETYMITVEEGSGSRYLSGSTSDDRSLSHTDRPGDGDRPDTGATHVVEEPDPTRTDGLSVSLAMACATTSLVGGMTDRGTNGASVTDKEAEDLGWADSAGSPLGSLGTERFTPISYPPSIAHTYGLSSGECYGEYPPEMCAITVERESGSRCSSGRAPNDRNLSHAGWPVDDDRPDTDATRATAESGRTKTGGLSVGLVVAYAVAFFAGGVTGCRAGAALLPSRFSLGTVIAYAGVGGVTGGIAGVGILNVSLSAISAFPYMYGAHRRRGRGE